MNSDCAIIKPKLYSVVVIDFALKKYLFILYYFMWGDRKMNMRLSLSKRILLAISSAFLCISTMPDSQAAAVGEYISINATGGAVSSTDTTNQTSTGAQAPRSIAIGENASTANQTGASGSIAIGYNSTTNTNGNAISIGSNSNAAGVGSVTLGYEAGTTNTSSLTTISIGRWANNEVAGEQNIAIGDSAGSYKIDGGQSASNRTTYNGTITSNSSGNVSIGLLAGANVTPVSTGWIAGHNTFIGQSTGYNSTGDANVAMGQQAAQSMNGSYNVGLGDQAGREAKGSYNYFGQERAGFRMSGSNNIAIGYWSNNGFNIDGTAVTADNTIALGYKTLTRGSNSNAIGYTASANGASSNALGDAATASGEKSIAIGTGAEATGIQSISIGTSNSVVGDYSGAIGNPSTVSGDRSYSIGNTNTVSANDAFVLGNSVTADVDNSVYLGANSRATVGSAINTAVLKSDGSEGSTTTAGDTGTVSSATVNGVTYGGFAGATASGVVTVGASGTERRIQNVAAGEISKTSTDAINGSQLYAVANTVATIDSRMDKVGAGAAALAALHPLDFDPDAKWDFAAGYGNYAGADAVAIGAYYRPDEDTMFSVGSSFGGGENMINAGVSLKVGGGNHVSTSKVAMAKEIKDLRKEVEALKSGMLDVNAGKRLDTSKLQLFPDVPKNHWAYEYVSVLKGNGMLEGYPDGTFDGDRPMTRYEFATMLYRSMLNGAELSERLLQEFAPELERFTVDAVHTDKNGNPTIERVRVTKNK